jgi:hypothetical protein
MAQVFRHWNRGQLPPFAKLRIDSSHPLANGLLACYVPGVSGGINLAGRGGNLTPVNSAGNQTWDVGPDGPAWKTTIGGDALSGLAPAAFLGSNNSFYWRGIFTSVPASGNGNYLMGIGYDNVSSAPYLFQSVDISHSSGFICLEFDNGGYTRQDDPNVVPVNTVIGSCATFSLGGVATIYRNGVSVGTVAYTVQSTSTATSTIYICGNNASTARTIPAKTFFGCIWNRALSANEVAALDADPYGFLIPDEGEWPVIYLPAAVSARVTAGTLPFMGVG